MNVQLPSAIGTLHRKLSRSLAQRGVWGTLKRCALQPLQRMYWLLREFTPNYRRHRAEELAFDREFQVDTRVAADPGWMAQISSPNWVHGVGYAPAPIRGITAILGGLGIDYEQYTFIDIGAGKGRCLFLAADLPFRKIIGIEYSAPLYETLQKNLAAYRNSQQCCYELEAVLEDATRYSLPPEPLVLFFHHPFEAPVFRAVVERIERTLEECPRDIIAIYYDTICGDVFDDSPYFERYQSGARQWGIPQSAPWTVFRSCPPPAIVPLSSAHAE